MKLWEFLWTVICALWCAAWLLAVFSGEPSTAQAAMVIASSAMAKIARIEAQK